MTTNKKRSKDGLLAKHSAKRLASFFKPSWEIYHFQLVAGAYLQYFHKGTMTKPHKQMFVSEVVSIMKKDDCEGKPFCFELVSSDKHGFKETWLLAAKSEEERMVWMEAVRPGSSESKAPQNLHSSQARRHTTPSPSLPHTTNSPSPSNLQPQAAVQNQAETDPFQRRRVDGSNSGRLGPSNPLEAGNNVAVPPPYQTTNPYPNLDTTHPNQWGGPSVSPQNSPLLQMQDRIPLQNQQMGVGTGPASGNSLSPAGSHSQFQFQNPQVGVSMMDGSQQQQQQQRQQQQVPVPLPRGQQRKQMKAGIPDGNGTSPHESASYGVNLEPGAPHKARSNSLADTGCSGAGYETIDPLEESTLQDMRLDLIRSRSMSSPLKSDFSPRSGSNFMTRNSVYDVPKSSLTHQDGFTDSREYDNFQPEFPSSGNVTNMPMAKPRKPLGSTLASNIENQTADKKQNDIDSDGVGFVLEGTSIGGGDSFSEYAHAYHTVDRGSTFSSTGSKSIDTPTQSLGKLLPFMEMSPDIGGPLNLLSASDLDDFRSKFQSALLFCSDIKLEDEIGEGAFGIVYKGQVDREGIPQQVAIKTIRNCQSKNELINFLEESALMRGFDHPNVLGLCGVCLDTPKKEPLIVLPYMANGDLKSYLRNKRGDSPSVDVCPEGLSRVSLQVFCYQIALGMEYLEQKHFVHRDLAARNCMIDDDMRVKVADFGMARDMASAEYYKITSRQKLPLKWMAPESFYDGRFSSKSDVWAFAVACWEIFSLGRPPYAGITPFQLIPFLEAGSRMSQPTLCSDQMFVIMNQCWDKVPGKRPTFSGVLRSMDLICGDSEYVNF